MAAPAAAAPPPWLEVKSAHFTVITDAGEKDGRRAAWQFEQIRSALLQIWPWAKIDRGQPFVVFAARSEATLKTLGPQFWEGKRFRPAGFGAQGRDRHFIAVRTDVAEPDEVGTNPYQTAYWTYVSAVFNRSFPRHVPDWYARGVAEVMSNTIVREKEIHVGRPIRENIQLARDRVPAPSLTSLPPLTVQTCTQPPPSWSAGVISIGGTRPPSVKPLIGSMPFLTSSPVGSAPPLALMALRTASTCSAAIMTPRL